VIQTRSAKVLALIPNENAPSETSDMSDDEIDLDYHQMISSPECSSATPSPDSYYERLILLCSSDDENNNYDKINQMYTSLLK
jgi:hypothetical protein